MSWSFWADNWTQTHAHPRCTIVDALDLIDDDILEEGLDDKAVINFSASIPTPSQQDKKRMEDKLRYLTEQKGVVFVTSAGNRGNVSLHSSLSPLRPTLVDALADMFAEERDYQLP